MASGLGLGWTHQLSVDSPAVSWTSLSTAAAIVGKALLGAGHPAAVDATMRAVRRGGEWLAAAATAALWWVALWRAPLRRAPLAYLTVALAVVSVLVPSVQPWYFCWALAFAGLVIRTERVIVLAATVCVAFPMMTRPNGNGWDRTRLGSAHPGRLPHPLRADPARPPTRPVPSSTPRRCRPGPALDAPRGTHR